jgi:hypothetical protein
VINHQASSFGLIDRLENQRDAKAGTVIDGQTISDQTGVTFSSSIAPGIAEGIEVIYGNVPPEFGVGRVSEHA